MTTRGATRQRGNEPNCHWVTERRRGWAAASSGPKGLQPRRVEKRSSRCSGKKEGSKLSAGFWPKKRKCGSPGQKEVGWNNMCTVT
jgi:hypothetical protein